MKARPILRYHGGKWMLAKWIISHFPPHRIYVEPYGGAASVLLQKTRSYSEVYNDQWDTVVNVFRVMRDPDKVSRLKELLVNTPFARVEFEDTSVIGINCDIERARRTIFRSFAGFGSASTNGDYPTGFRVNSNRSGTTPAHDWVNYPLHLDRFLERLRGVVIENRDAANIIKQHDSEATLFYVDPPYVHATRNFNRGNAAYAREMTDADHILLSTLLHSVSGMVVLSGYRSALYDVLYSTWRRIDREALADGARSRIESLWLNPRAAISLQASV